MRDVRVGEDLFKIVLGGSCEDPSKVGCGGNQRYLHFDHAILWVRSSVVVSYLGHPDILQHYREIALRRSFAVSQFGDQVARVAGPVVDPGYQRDRTDHRKKAKNRGYSRRYFWLVQGLHRRRSRSSRRLQCRSQQESCRIPDVGWGIGPCFCPASGFAPSALLASIDAPANSEAFFRRAQKLDSRLFELLKSSPACAATRQNSTKSNKSTWACFLLRTLGADL